MGKNTLSRLLDPLNLSGDRTKKPERQPLPEDTTKAVADPVNTENLDAAEAQRQAEARRKRISSQRQVPRSAIKTRSDQSPGLSVPRMNK